MAEEKDEKDDAPKEADEATSGDKAAPAEASDAKVESEEKKPASPWPSSRKGDNADKASDAKVDAAPAAAPAPAASGLARAAWAAPLHRLDKAWTKLDTRLCAAVLVTEALALVFWLSVDAMSKTGKGGPGMTFRILLTAVILGTVTHLGTRKLKQHQLATTMAVVVGIALGTQWGDLGAAYFANYYGWMQNASILVFFGGIGEIAKRLTFWLALLGASVATGQGKHITVDVVMRVISPRARVPVAVLGWLVAALVSGSAAWGFFDSVAVEQFHVPSAAPCPGDATKSCKTTGGAKIDKVLDTTARNTFLATRQLTLDLRTFPKVLAGDPYGKWLTAKEWNAWLREGGWEKHFAKADVLAFELPEDSTDFRQPAVTAVPGGADRIEQLMVPLLNLVFPFGMFVIAIRFVIRSILAIAGWVNVDPDAAHGDDELAHAHDPNAPSVEGDPS
jgi:Tripartite ATP-independent periplasmic transporters, DctQ component